MVVFSLVAKFRALTTALAATTAIFGVTPAFANSSASADIAAPLRAAQTGKQTTQGKADDQFRKLFNNWKSLDSNDPANYPARRGVTSELYGGGAELRLNQELVLGIAGWRLLHTLGIKPEVCHLNEGHSAFVILERARTFMEETGHPFEVALAVTRAGNLFTTHTPVDAGFDRFSPSLIEQYLGWYCRDRLGIPVEDVLALGRQNPNDFSEPFNMSYLAVRGSGAVKGVSRLHAKVSRRIFTPLFPRWPEVEVPMGYVTNGVHMPTWDSSVADDLWTQACTKDRWRGETEPLGEQMANVPDVQLWDLRATARKSLIEYVRERLSRQLEASGASPQEVEEARHVFDSNALTLGFARRFAPYKRPNLLLHDPERSLSLGFSSRSFNHYHTDEIRNG